MVHETLTYLPLHYIVIGAEVCFKKKAFTHIDRDSFYASGIGETVQSRK